jgi:Xaa-Pro aminopeptidase
MTEKRIIEFQKRMKEKGVDGAMIKTASSFTFFADVMWLRPGLIIPAEGDPVAFIAQNEVEAFRERSCVKKVVPYHGIDELMPGVTRVIRQSGLNTVGMDMSVERDAFELFGHMFARLNPKVEIVDVHSLIMELRMFKDASEIERSRRAAQVTDKGMDAALGRIAPGASELEVAAEAVYAMMRAGSERPHVYVNAGPIPRIHAEPRANQRIAGGDVVTVTIGGDAENYYCNETRTYVPSGASPEKRRAFQAVRSVYESITPKLRPGVVLESIEEEIGASLTAQGYSDHYVKGFAHGVGLLVEEDPITTILMPHRRMALREGMVIAAMHAPLAVPGAGSFKIEDTFLITPNGPEQLTKHPMAVA